jgi:hypothetical protein
VGLIVECMHVYIHRPTNKCIYIYLHTLEVLSAAECLCLVVQVPAAKNNGNWLAGLGDSI